MIANLQPMPPPCRPPLALLLARFCIVLHPIPTGVYCVEVARGRESERAEGDERGRRRRRDANKRVHLLERPNADHGAISLHHHGGVIDFVFKSGKWIRDPVTLIAVCPLVATVLSFLVDSVSDL